MSMETVWINKTEKRVETGTLLGEILREDGSLEMPCAGKGRCGKCRVKASGALSEPDDVERTHLSQEELAAGVRLACRARVLGTCSVALEEHKKSSILLGGREWSRTDASAPPMFAQLGAAVDIGTTTLAAQLYDESGLLAQAGAVNPQEAFGADVISRIERSMAGEGAALAQAVRHGISGLLQELAKKAGRSAEQIDAVVITGNTAMLYLLTGRDPVSLSRAPFEADWLAGEWLTGAELELPCAEAKVYLPPCISAFVGADISTAILAAGLSLSEEGAKTAETTGEALLDARMLVDIGTNGEIVLWKDGHYYCCATAAGPAFEGAGLSMGMRGEEGAISHVALENGALMAEVIGNTEPRGICGSGVVDAVRCLLLTEQVDETGYMEDEEAEIAGGVLLTQEDVRKVQLAKSAICAGAKAMLHQAGMEEADLKELLVAGGFGSYLNLENAVAIGLLPEMDCSRIRVCGNAALDGAAALLLGQAEIERVTALVSRATALNLAEDEFFVNCYMEGMMFEV